jgi:protein-disulfide isomerase
LHFAFLGPESVRAAEASECAAEQDAFWPYHDELFARQTQSGAFSDEGLNQIAADLGLDTAAFAECLSSGRYADLVAQDTALARSLQIGSTPTFLINGQVVTGAVDLPIFEQVFQQLGAQGTP